MDRLRRDPIGLSISLAIGAAIGLRTLQVAGNFRVAGNEFSEGFAQGTIIGCCVAFAFVMALAVWRLISYPGGVGGPRLVAVGGGIIAGAIAGAPLFGTS
jgi:hypothetical protein